ncbi:hypothetical protein FSST1_009943 [Fusarium sambucinum]
MSDPNKYTIGWICAISTEFVAARALFDEKHDDLDSTTHCDNNNYALGQIGKHNVAMAVMPKSEYGTTTAATVARDMLHTFQNIRFGLMVGIGGGAPSAKHDVRLGDIVVNTRGVYQYDYGTETQGRPFQITGFLNKPPQLLLTAISALEAKYELEGHQLNERIEAALHQYPRLRKKYSRPIPETDRLFQPDIVHPDLSGECVDLCHSGFKSPVDRGLRDEREDDPAIHYGMVASANRLIKDAFVRDSLVADKNVLCFEMEAAGLANHFSCVVIRGICDYSDTHKNDKWQGFAAMVAAAYAKDLLCQIPPSKVQAEIPVKNILTSLKDTTDATNNTVLKMASDHHNDKVLRWLSPPDYFSNANLARERRHHGSGVWLLDSPVFQDWKSGLRKNLWLYGLVGCGKTVLSTSILDDLLSSDLHTTLAFFFDFNDTRKQTLDDVLRSLAAQLYQTKRAPAKKLDELFACGKNGQEKPDTKALSACIDNMIGAAGPVFIIIDALDECIETWQMLQWLECSNFDNARILITGRPEQELKIGLFRLFGRQNCISLDKKAIDADIWSYVDTELKERPYFVDMNLSPDVLNLVRDKIGNGADGMFRWAACQLEVLAGCLSPRDTKIALESLPNNLDETYERMIGRIPPEKKPSAIRLLQFLIHTKRPLEVTEAVEVLATNIYMDPPGFSIDGRLFKPHDILRYCPSLIVIAESREWDRTSEELHLAHFSVKEYLLKQTEFDLGEASTAITSTCLAYLGDISDAENSVSFPMAEYAAKYWTEFAICSQDTADTTRSITGFLRDETKFRRWTHLYRSPSKFKPEPFALKASRLYFACLCNLREVARCLIAEGDDINAKGGVWHTPLLAAISRGNLEIVQLLLENGADANVKGNMFTQPLITASQVGNVEIIRLLLSRGAVKAGSRKYGTSLHVASSYRNLKVMRCLLEYGADVNACFGRDRDTALRAALLHHGRFYKRTAVYDGMEHSEYEVVRLLLDHGASVYNTDWMGSTALHVACTHNSSPETVRLLLEDGAEVNAKDNSAATAIENASRRGNLETMQLLIDNGAHSIGSGLYDAMSNKHLEGVQFLLDNGADVNAKDPRFGTPLNFALVQGYAAVAKMLYKSGAREEEGEEAPYRCDRPRLRLSDVMME